VAHAQRRGVHGLGEGAAALMIWGGIKAVAFDIDGTLYPEWRLNLIALPYVLCHLRYFLNYGKVRSAMHVESRAQFVQGSVPQKDAITNPNFFQEQADRLATVSGQTPSQALKQIEEIIYRGLSPFFKKIPLYPFAREAIEAFHGAGLKIGLLSDFPPEQKGDVWGIAPYCDVILGSEKLGALKPSPVVFEALKDALGVEAAEILYVGNSLRSDIYGARNAGMKTAWLSKKSAPEADFCFTSYRQLTKFVLN
jgi:putative hydrolase of the HAD superfamily